MNREFRRWAFALAASLCAVVMFSQTAAAQQPRAEQILPHSTLAVVRIADVPQLTERFQQTAIGRVAQDPQMKPLVSELFRSVQDAFRNVEGVIGLSLAELLKIPQGEVCVGFIATEDFEQPPGVIGILDTRNEAAQARKLLAAAEQIASRNGGNRVNEKFGDDDVAVFTGLGPTKIFVVEHDGLFVFASTKSLMDTALANLNGTGLERTLADNEKFKTLVSRCIGAGDEQPQITWYADPIALVRRLASGSLAATGLALFPVLGIDGLQAVGGTMTYGAGDFDEVSHMHALLDNPRVGVIDAIGVRPGDMTPETWVPADCISYSTIHWDLKHTLRVAAKLYNGLMGDGALEQQLQEKLSAPLGADVINDVLPQLTGRATHAQWVEKPVRFNSISTFVGVELRDPQAFKPILEKVLQKHASNLEKQRYGTIEYWSVKNAPRRQREMGPDMRQPLPCVGIVNNYLLMSDSLKAFQEAVTAQTNPDQSLSTSLDFKLIASKIRRQPGGDAPGAVQFSRPEEGLRFWYELANAEATRKRLADQANRNQFFGSVEQALKNNPLPPFSVISEYMAPGGGMLVNDETGIHYTTFTLKRK